MQIVLIIIGIVFFLAYFGYKAVKIRDHIERNVYENQGDE
jgi:hypothetical protein